MNVVNFYQKLLNPPVPWKVCKVELSDDGRRVDIWLEHDRYTFLCSKCHCESPTYDHMPERIFQHLDTCESKTFLHARLPRVKCATHGVVQGVFPLAGPYLDVTYGLEAHCIAALKACDRSDAAELTGVSWERLGGIMNRAVARGLARRGDVPPKVMGLDEKQVFARHKYFTIITDIQNRSVFDVVDGRAEKVISPWFEARKDVLITVKCTAMDMSAGYAKISKTYMPTAEKCFDHYHVIAIVNKAVDEVRREEQQLLADGERKDFFRSRFCFLYGQENLPENMKERFERAKAVSAKTGKAWAIKESLRELWQGERTPEECNDYFQNWFWWATHSRLQPIRKAAHTLKRHWDGILAAITLGISNALTEGINSKIETIKRGACGYRNKENFRIAILFHCGKLDMHPEPAI